MIDFHFHSNKSDGKHTIKELSERIIDSQVKTCALTDHDIVSGIVELTSLCQKRGVSVIPGVELTALWEGGEIHILAFDFDINVVSQIVEERNNIVLQQRKNELALMQKKFKSEGFQVSLDLQVDMKKPVGRLVGEDIYSFDSNKNKIVTEYGRLLSEKDFYDEFQSLGGRCYVPRSGVDLQWIINQFANVAQDLILAHPFVPVSFASKDISTIKEVDEIVTLGLTGVEVYHNNTSSEQIDKLYKYVTEENLSFSGGSDNHGKSGDAKYGRYGEELLIPEARLKNFVWKLG